MAIPIMEKRIASAMARKEELLKEIEKLKADIEELEEQTSEENVPSIKSLMKALKISEHVNEIKYTNVEVTSGEEKDTLVYEADATTGPVKYHLHFKIKTISEKKTSVSDLKIMFYDDFMQNELRSWVNKCMRQSCLQIFARASVSYGKLFAKRDEILNYLKEKAPEHFMVEKCLEEGKYVVIAVNKATNTQYFYCEWALMESAVKTCTMINDFILHAHNKELFFTENKHLFAELTDSPSNLTCDRVEEIWKTLAKNVIQATEGSSTTSSLQ